MEKILEHQPKDLKKDIRKLIIIFSIIVIFLIVLSFVNKNDLLLRLFKIVP